MTFLHRRMFLVIALFTMSAVALPAQDMQSPPQGKAFERVEQFKKMRLIELLNLDEQTAIRFFALYNENQKQLREIRQEQVQALGAIQKLRKSEAADAEYGKVVDQLRALESKLNDTKTKYIDEIKQVLTAKQLAEYLVFEFRFQQNLRELVRDMQRNRQDMPRR
jgi:hypothetical protein